MKLIKKALMPIVGSLFPKSIVFESYPDFADNTKAVYDELVRRGYDKKYHLMWYIDWDTAAYYNDGNPIIWKVTERKTIHEKIRNIIYRNRKCTITCNRFVKRRGNELIIFLNHGSPIKSAGAYYKMPDYVDLFLIQSDQFKSILNNDYGTDTGKMIATGFARNDALLRDKVSLQEKFGVDKQTKVIAWYPTFRQHKSGIKTASQHALPIIHDYDIAVTLNEIAKENNILIVLKPHFAQDLSMIKKTEFSNLRFIDDTFFKNNGMTSYSFIGSTDALLTDYSSIYYDYTLCDKPIGVIWEDLEEYRENPGFAVDLDYWLKGAEKIYTFDDLKAFLIRVSRGEDILQTERRDICSAANYSLKPDNASRVADLIIKKAKL